MGIKGKLLKRFKRTRPKSSDASVDNTTIATKEVHPSTPIENGHQYLIDPTPIRLPVLGLVDGDVPSTPKPVSSGNGQQVSPDHTNSTKSSSIQSEEKQDADTIVPDMNTMEDNKNIFTELTDRAFGLVKMSSDLSDASKKVAIGEFTGDGVNKKEAVIVPDTSSADQVEIQRASSAVEFTSDPVDLDGGGSVRSNRSSSTSGSGRKSVKLEEKARSSESRVSSFGRLFGESLEKVDEAERQDVNVDKVQEVTKDDTEITEEEEPIRNSTSWVRDIEKHALNKSPSDDGEKKTRQVSFDSEEHHIEDDYVTYEDEESSYDSSEFDDDSQYYDDQYEGGNNDDDIDEATYMSGDSMMLTENDGLWGWLCGYGNFNLSPGSLEDQTDDKSVGTSVHSSDSADMNDSEGDEGEELSYRQVKAVRTMSSSKMSRKLRVVSPAPRLPSLLKKKEPKPETVSTPTPQEIKEVESEQVSPEAPKEKKEIKPKEQPQEQKSATKTQTAKEHFNGATTQPEKDQPRDFQGFPVKVNILPKKSAKLTQSTKSAQDAKKKEQDPPDDATAATSTSKSKSNVSSKDSRQLEVYCKGHGGAENLVLRKYPTIPSPAGKNHVLVKVEVSHFQFL
jgi:outer membrane biosynthesis protein TonB